MTQVGGQNFFETKEISQNLWKKVAKGCKIKVKSVLSIWSDNMRVIILTPRPF